VLVVYNVLVLPNILLVLPNVLGVPNVPDGHKLQKT
jgi:hypothetical protein